MREPEAVFWALFFPVLITAGLGVAFRSRPAEVLKVARRRPASPRRCGRSRRSTVAELRPARPAAQLLRTGKVALLVRAGADGAVVYRYDDTNPEGRTARMLADRAIQRGGRPRRSRCRAADELVREAGSRYIDFLVPGLVGLGIMSNALWGLGFSIVDSRRRKLTKRLVATPMSRTYYLLSFLLWRMIAARDRGRRAVGFGALAFGVPVRGRCIDLVVDLRPRRRSRSARWRCSSRQPGADDRGGVRPDEPRAGADVDSVRRVLLGAALSRRRAAVHQALPLTALDRRAARAHAAGRRTRPARAAARPCSASGWSCASRWR